MRKRNFRLNTGLLLAAFWLLASLSACGNKLPAEMAGTLPALTVSLSEPQPSGSIPLQPSGETLLPPESSLVRESSFDSAAESGQDPCASRETAACATRMRPDKTRPLPQEDDSGASAEETNPEAEPVTDYGREEHWAYLGMGEDKAVDLFLLAPTVVENGVFLHMEDARARKLFSLSLDKQRGLYEARCSLYAPYYRQMAEEVYGWSEEEQKIWRDQAYRDAAAAFRFFLDRYDRGKPLILAGFSQGSELSLRLMQEFFDPATEEGRRLLNRLVAVYAIGAGFPESMVHQYPWMQPAEGRRDTGVIISFDCELPGITHSVLLPAGSRSMSINPLSWSREGVHADRSLNKGAYFPAINLEEPHLCGCYIEPVRGALIVTDINPEYFPVDSNVLPPGNLHEYDYQFFYRNIQENVIDRIEAFFLEP